MTEHEHRWKLVMHLDGCHFYTTTAACKCGASIARTDERDLKDDPWSAVWMEETYEEVTRDERGRFVQPHWEVVVCERCRELQAGATPRHDVIVTGKNGQVESEEHS